VIRDDGSVGHSEFSIATLRATTLSNRPEVRAARARIAAGEATVRLAQRAWIPDPSFKVEGQRYNESSQSLSEFDAGISFSVPWGNPRKYSAGVTEARANLAAAQAALERTETEAVGLLRDALQKVTTAHHHVGLFRDKLVPQMRQAFQATQLAYENGKATFGEWIAVQRNLRDMEAEARMHLTDYQTALAELESVVGADLNLFPSSDPAPTTK
jgi:outer membrane protein TolC